MFDFDKILTEVTFKTSRSGGPGGQNVNKTETKVAMSWDLGQTLCFSETQKEFLLLKLSSKLDSEGKLTLTSSKTRSQLANKEDVINKLRLLLIKSLVKPKRRIASKPSKGAVEKRIVSKKKIGETKQRRKKIDPGNI